VEQPLAVTGPLTDAELRATPVPVSGNVAVAGSVTVEGGLTDVELRAVPVPVSGTVSVNEPVSVDDNGGSLTVDGPLTDAQLRAAPVPVSGTLSVTEPVSVDDNGGSLTVDGPLTDAELRAAPVPVSGTISVNEPVSVDDNGGSLTIDTPQLPAALVGGRLDENVGAWLGSTAPTVGQKNMADSVPVVIASDQGAVAITDNGTSVTVDGTLFVTNIPGTPISVSIDDVGPVFNGGGGEANSLRVTIASDSTGLLSVDDNGGSLTVDGPLTDVQLRASDVPVNARPYAHDALGHYQISGTTGTMAAGIVANSQILQFRYTGANLAVVYDVTIDEFRSLGTAFAAGPWLFALTRITGWTVDGTGGATITPLKLRTSMGAAVATVRIATTAALGAGTSTLDASNLRDIRGIAGTAANQIQMAPFQTTGTAVLGRAPEIQMLPFDIPGAHPLVLTTNEGFCVKVIVPGTGTWQAVLKVRWAEVTSF
jgi:hypothetical protein